LSPLALRVWLKKLGGLKSHKFLGIFFSGTKTLGTVKFLPEIRGDGPNLLEFFLSGTKKAGTTKFLLEIGDHESNVP